MTRSDCLLDWVLHFFGPVFMKKNATETEINRLKLIFSSLFSRFIAHSVIRYSFNTFMYTILSLGT